MTDPTQNHYWIEINPDYHVLVRKDRILVELTLDTTYLNIWHWGDKKYLNLDAAKRDSESMYIYYVESSKAYVEKGKWIKNDS